MMDVMIRNDEYFICIPDFCNRYLVAEGRYLSNKFSSIIDALINCKYEYNRYDCSVIETDFIVSILNKNGYDLILHEDFVTDAHDNKGNLYEFKRIKKEQMNKNIYVKKKFFHYKKPCIWIEYADDFSEIKVYDLRKIDMKIEKDYAFTLENVKEIDRIKLINNGKFNVIAKRI